MNDGAFILVNPPADKPYARDNYSVSVAKGSYYLPPIDLVCLSGWSPSKENTFLIDGIVHGHSYKSVRDVCDCSPVPRTAIMMTCQYTFDSDMTFGKLLVNQGLVQKLLVSGSCVAERP